MPPDNSNRRSLEIMQLSELGSMLQTCLTTEEAYETITRYAEKLFPGDTGRYINSGLPVIF